MNSALRDDPEALTVVAAQIEQHTGIPQAHIEKDYWVTEILRSIAAHCSTEGVNIAFKGGTSLSKAFRLIERFSEDIDIFFTTSGLTKADIDHVMEGIITAAALGTGLSAVDDPRKRVAGVKRAARLAFGAPEGGASVLLELGARGGDLPKEQRDINSLVFEHGPAAGVDARLTVSAGFRMHVTKPVRTLVEKLMIVHHAASAESPDQQYRHARHYYDIWCLLRDPSTRRELEDNTAASAAYSVETFTRKANEQATPRPHAGFAESTAFDPVKVPEARRAFDAVVLDQLLWPQAQRPTFDDCCNIVHANAELL